MKYYKDSHYSKQPKNISKNIIAPTVNYYRYLLLIIFLTILFFIKVSSHEFTNWDDNYMVTNNTQIRSLSFEGLIDMFTPSGEMNEYQPLTTLSYAIVYYFFKLKATPYLLLNLIFHLLNIVLVFYILMHISNNHRLSLFVCLLFALHPFQVEVVAWVSAHNYVLFGFFFLLSLLSYIKYIQSDLNKKYFIFTMIFFILSLFAKGTAVIFPIVLFCFDYYFKRKMSFRLFYEKFPFFLISLIFGIIALIPKSDNQAVLTFSENFIFTDRIFFGFYSLSFYIIKLIVPYNLNVIYLYPDKTGNFLPYIFYITPIFIFGFLYFLKLNKIDKQTVNFGFLFFLSNIFLILHFIPFYHAGIVAERYVYLGSIGFFMMLATFILYFIDKYAKGRHILYMGLSLYIGFLFLTTFNRIDVWASSITLWTDAIKKDADNAIAYNNRGIVENELKKTQDALKDYNKAIEINPHYADAYNNRGNIKEKTGNFKEAIEDFNKVVEIEPLHAYAFYKRGVSKVKLGNNAEAINDYTKAIEINPRYKEAFVDRGIAKGNLNDYAGAIADFNKTIELDSHYTDAFNNRGITYAMIKNFELAQRDFEQSLKINKNSPDVYLYLGMLFIETNNTETACDNLKKAEELGSFNASELIKKHCQQISFK